MSILPMLRAIVIINALLKAGFVVIRQKGSHVILVRQTNEGKKALVVPNHREVDKGTLLEIIRQAGLTKEEFLNMV